MDSVGGRTLKLRCNDEFEACSVSVSLIHMGMTRCCVLNLNVLIIIVGGLPCLQSILHGSLAKVQQQIAGATRTRKEPRDKHQTAYLGDLSVQKCNPVLA